MYTRHEESSAVISASRERVFAALDDHSRLSSHMSKSSWRLGGAKMEIVVDAQQGRSVGSHIILRGSVLGVSLFVEEVVVAHDAPVRKTWETIGTPRLLVVGPYRMSFELQGSGTGTRLCVAIDYELPVRGVERLLGRLFGRLYARWCTQQMVRDAARLFAAPAATV
jgi:hypothetical protein